MVSPPAAARGGRAGRLQAGVVAARSRSRDRAAGPGRLQVNGEPLGDGGASDGLRLAPDLGPVMAGPLLPEALYRDSPLSTRTAFCPARARSRPKP